MMRGRFLALEAWRFEVIKHSYRVEMVRYHTIKYLRFVKGLINLRHVTSGVLDGGHHAIDFEKDGVSSVVCRRYSTVCTALIAKNCFNFLLEMPRSPLQ